MNWLSFFDASLLLMNVDTASRLSQDPASISVDPGVHLNA